MASVALKWLTYSGNVHCSVKVTPPFVNISIIILNINFLWNACVCMNMKHLNALQCIDISKSHKNSKKMNKIVEINFYIWFVCVICAHTAGRMHDKLKFIDFTKNNNSTNWDGLHWMSPYLSWWQLWFIAILNRCLAQCVLIHWIQMTLSVDRIDLSIKFHHITCKLYKI